MSANRVFKVTDVADYSEMRGGTYELKRAYVGAVKDVMDYANTVAVNAAMELGGVDGCKLLDRKQARALYALIYGCETMLDMFEDDVREDAYEDMSEALFLVNLVRSLKVTDDASEGGR